MLCVLRAPTEEGAGPSGTRVTAACEPPGGGTGSSSSGRAANTFKGREVADGQPPADPALTQRDFTKNLGTYIGTTLSLRGRIESDVTQRRETSKEPQV